MAQPTRSTCAPTNEFRIKMGTLRKNEIWKRK